MTIWEWRRRRKAARHWRHELRRTRALCEDIAAPATIDRVDRALERLEAAQRAGTSDAFEAACAEAEAAIAAARPPNRKVIWGEHLETVVVALTLAMAIRCFWVQPFKIPTGSMQPTLHGVTFVPQAGRTWRDIPPINWINWALFGEGYVEVRARASGFFAPQGRINADGDFIVFIDDTPHTIRRNMPTPWRKQPGDYVQRGEVLASGRMRFGDHVLVNKVVYYFRRPRRGEIIVFDTEGIRHPQIRAQSFYIKRLVGLPGERVQISPPWVMINGERLTEPAVFRRQVEAVAEGYRGYEWADARVTPRPLLAGPEDAIEVPMDMYLPLGDNTRSSLDGRYFGPIHWRKVVGPAVVVYWPFSKRWGMIR